MDRQTWSDLPTFVAVARARSFTGAAAALGISPSAVSHAVRALEARLDTRLFNRTTRSVALTAAAERLLATLDPAIGRLDEALDDLEQQRDRPAGRVRITAHRTAARFTVLPRLRELAELYPDITLDLAVDDGIVDIVAAGFDAGIRRSAILAPDMVSARLDDGVDLAYVAAPAYLADAGPLAEPADLFEHQCINYRYPSSAQVHRWTFERGANAVVVDAPGTLTFNDVDLVLDAALAGYGVACVTLDQALPFLETGRLARVLTKWSPRLPPNHLYYSGRRHLPPPLRAVIELLRREA